MLFCNCSVSCGNDWWGFASSSDYFTPSCPPPVVSPRITCTCWFGNAVWSRLPLLCGVACQQIDLVLYCQHDWYSIFSPSLSFSCFHLLCVICWLILCGQPAPWCLLMAIWNRVREASFDLPFFLSSPLGSTWSLPRGSFSCTSRDFLCPLFLMKL